MMKHILAVTILMIQVAAQADLVSTFKSMEKSRKGPFSLNYLQGSSERLLVTDGRTPRDLQFQAAFRNEIGQELAIQNDFWVANLFTTNYYELMGEYVYGDAYSSHPLDHATLVRNGAQAMKKAASMTRHWVMEKHYTKQYPNSMLAKSFKIRGVSGSEFEQTYATHFFNFYLSAVTNEFQYLPAFILATDSPIGGGSALNRARDLISDVYERVKTPFNGKSAAVAKLYEIRNIIHNQLSPTAVDEIDMFLKDFPSYRWSVEDDLLEIRQILVNFFGFTPDKIAASASLINESAIKAAAQKLQRNGVTMAGLVELSATVADLRTRVVTSKVAYQNKSEAMKLIVNTSLYINKEITAQRSFTSPQVVEVIINTIYMEGFLLKDNWLYFKDELASKRDLRSAAQLLPDVVEIATDSLNEAFRPSLDQWKKVEPQMHYFIDNTVKSSSLNMAALVANRLGRF